MKWKSNEMNVRMKCSSNEMNGQMKCKSNRMNVEMKRKSNQMKLMFGWSVQEYSYIYEYSDEVEE